MPKYSFLAMALLMAASVAQAQTTDACPPFMWGTFLSPGEQDYTVRDRRELDDGTSLMGVAFGDLVGDYAKVAMVLRSRDDCTIAVLSHGSYGYLVDAQTGARTYHLDLYEPGTHATMSMGGPRLTYEAVWERALEMWSTP